MEKQSTIDLDQNDKINKWQCWKTGYVVANKSINYQKTNMNMKFSEYLDVFIIEMGVWVGFAIMETNILKFGSILCMSISWNHTNESHIILSMHLINNCKNNCTHIFDLQYIEMKTKL